jgi:DNA ligase-1
MFPELTEGLRQQLCARRAIVEGEAVAYNPASRKFLPFQTSLTRKRRTGIAQAAARHPLRLFAFDLVYAGGRNCLPLPQRERSGRLRELLRFGPDDPLAVTEALTADRPRELQAYFDTMIRRGLEGIVAKWPDATYHAGARRYTWVEPKRAHQGKLRDTLDLVVVGYLAGG